MSILGILQITDIGFFDPIAILFFVAATVAFWAVWVVLKSPLDPGDSQGGEAREEEPAAPPQITTHPTGRPRRLRQGGSGR